MPKAISAKQYRLLSMPYAQCRVYIKRFDNGGVSVELVSYETSVLILNSIPGGGTALYCSGTYRATTARHINRFTREFCGDNKYFACKSAIGDPVKFVGCGWFYVCHAKPELLLKMCERYEAEARGYYGRY